MNTTTKGIIVVAICIFFIVLMGYTTFKITDKSLRDFDAKCEKEYGKDNYIIYSCNGGFGSYCCQPKIKSLPIQFNFTLNPPLHVNKTGQETNMTIQVQPQ